MSPAEAIDRILADRKREPRSASAMVAIQGVGIFWLTAAEYRRFQRETRAKR